jgi:hypothetical protein
MLANFFFSDLFTDVDSGIVPATTGIAVGTTSGSAIAIGGAAGFQKLLFEALFAAGSAAGSVSMFLATASVASGTFASISQTLVSIVTTLSLSANYRLRIDTRDVAFANLSSVAAAPTFVQVVVAVAGAAIPGAMHVLGWQARQDVSSVFQPRTIPVTAQTTFY